MLTIWLVFFVCCHKKAKNLIGFITYFNIKFNNFLAVNKDFFFEKTKKNLASQALLLESVAKGLVDVGIGLGHGIAQSLEGRQDVQREVQVNQLWRANRVQTKLKLMLLAVMCGKVERKKKEKKARRRRRPMDGG